MLDQHRRTSTSALLGLLGLLALGACDDAGAPLAPDTATTVVTEAVLDGAADQVAVEQDALLDEGQRVRPSLDRAGLAVDFADSAVELASELLREAGGGDTAQTTLLARAQGQADGAQAALEAGRSAAAMRLAHGAVATAMKAWILPGGVSEEEVRLVQATAEEMLREATGVVGSADDLPAQVLSWAQTFFDRGMEKIAAGQPRGVVALWRSAVLSHWLIG